jgi:hypothetical protein
VLIIKSALCSCTLPVFYPERCTVIDLLHAVLRTENGAHQADKLPAEAINTLTGDTFKGVKNYLRL